MHKIGLLDLKKQIDAGKSVAQLATHFNCSESTIYRKLSSYQLKISSSIPLNKLTYLVQTKEYSAKECAHYFNASLSSIYRALKMAGLSIKPAQYNRDLTIYFASIHNVSRPALGLQYNMSRQQIFNIIRNIERRHKPEDLSRFTCDTCQTPFESKDSLKSEASWSVKYLKDGHRSRSNPSVICHSCRNPKSSNN